MCWSFEVSLITGTMSYSIATYLWIRNYKNDRWHAIFLFVVSTIQFMDAILWRENKDGTNTSSDINRIVIIILIPLILALEPVSALYGATLVGKDVSTFDKIFYLIIFLGLLMLFIRKNSYPDIFVDNGIQYQKGTKKHLDYWIFCLLFMYPFIKYAELNRFYILFYIFAAIILIISLTKSTPGSTWCLYANAFAIYALFYPYIIKK